MTAMTNESNGQMAMKGWGALQRARVNITEEKVKH
jgi:hypothetical protein